MKAMAVLAVFAASPALAEGPALYARRERIANFGFDVQGSEIGLKIEF